MEFPVLVINFKIYSQASGKKAIKIAKIAEKVSKELKIPIIVCPPLIDIKEVASKVKIPVFSQHVDEVEPGAFTGHISAASLKEAGVRGTLLNHSEKKVNFKKIKKTILACRRYGLDTICCAENVFEAKRIATLKPNAIAIEPPELIGGNISVSTAKPSVITNGVKAVGKIPLLCGAGIKTMKDVEKAIELGAKGVLVASGICKAKNVERAILELAKGLKNTKNK